MSIFGRFLGTFKYNRGGDWKHLEPHPAVYGCGSESDVTKCVHMYLHGNETTHNLTSQWTLPMENNIKYAVNLKFRTTNEEAVCETGRFQAGSVLEDVDVAVRTLVDSGLVPGINYTFQLS